MIKRDYFGRPFAQDAAYKFGFCKYCPFYECELVEEYQQFIKVHCKNDAEDKFQPWKDADDGWHIKGVSTPRIEIGRTQVPAPASVTAADISSEIKALSYNPNDIKDCLMSHRYVCPIECGRQRVTEGVGDHFRVETNPNGDIKAGIKDRWEPIQPVFISAQTGQGKNYFIENTLIPYVRELNYNNTTRHKVLILSNRLALKQQISKRLKGDNYTDDEENGIYSYKDVADVMTYQSLLHQAHRLKKIQKDAHSRYIYVVCDEAHFFTSDAMFNPHTAKILSAIVALFQKSIRVYMSATPYECLEYIIKEEDDYWKCRNTGKPQDKWTSAMMVFYHFKRDYGYLDIKTYSDVSELFGIIAKSVNKKDGGRWLIFIDDKDKCETLKCKLEQYECSKNDDVATGETEEQANLIHWKEKSLPSMQEVRAMNFT